MRANYKVEKKSFLLSLMKGSGDLPGSSKKKLHKPQEVKNLNT